MFKYILLLELAIFMVGYSIAAPATLDQPRKDELGKFVVDGVTGERVEVSQIISQVENILSINPQLPRLTRGQILNLLKNITTEDNRSKDFGVTGKPKSKATTPTSVSKEQSTKPIMVVLPYNAANTEASKMVDLYTKRPIVTFVTQAPQREELEIINGDGAQLYSNEFKNHKYSGKGNENVEYKVESDTNDFWKEQAQNAMKDLVNSNKESDVKTEMTFKQLPSTLGEMKFVAENIPEIVEIKLSTKYKNEAGDGDVDFYPNPEQDKVVEDQLKDLLSTVDKYSKNNQSPIYPMLPGQNEYLHYDQISQESKQPSSETSAYSEFKPLPLSMMEKAKPVSKEVEEILSSFGILGSPQGWAPSQIKMENNEDPLQDLKIDPNMFPADMTSMLTEMGLTGRKDRMMEKPTASALTAGPDPLLKEDVEIHESNDIKNKRQSEEVTTTESITAATPESSTTEESSVDDSKSSSANESPNLADLENSFGASPADNDPSEAELPPPRRNGFYYMLDWNSFLEVGDGDRKVNIRFDPKLGDPQRFLKV